ncbi:MAG: GNAT family N-acetyltransferase [Mangrovibacterium sp.]
MKINLDYSDRVPEKVEPIGKQISVSLLIKEVNHLQNSNKSLLRKGTFELFCTKHSEIPALMYEIGRQREITFRKVGEGSNKSIDLDTFDKTYNHLVIWDHMLNQLVGAYRIGNGKELMNKMGIEALYTSTLFNFDKKIEPILTQGIELGRSFITESYQRKTLPLYLLWYGIFKFVRLNPWCKYLYGPVSISNNLCKLEKDRIVSYINKHHQHNTYSNYVSCKNKYTVDSDYDFEKDNPDLRKMKLPVLFRKYLHINEKIIEFNIDPLFNNSLDGFLFLDFEKIPHSFIERFYIYEAADSLETEDSILMSNVRS